MAARAGGCTRVAGKAFGDSQGCYYRVKGTNYRVEGTSFRVEGTNYRVKGADNRC